MAKLGGAMMRAASSILSVLIASLAACTPDLAVGARPARVDQVRMQLVPDRRGSSQCCRVFTINPTDQAVNVSCRVLAFDADGHLVLAELLPDPPPGHRRSSGFWAPPGRHAQGFWILPIDLGRDSYRGPCNNIFWHGAPPI